MFTLYFGHLPNPNVFEFKMFCLFDFAPFPEYVEEIYQTHMEAESSKFLDVAAAHRKVARERRQAKQKMTTRHCTMHEKETLERAHATFYAIAQRIKQDKELQKLNLQNNKIIIN